MKFEVINDKNKVMFRCDDVSCIPDPADIKMMSAGGYKFRIDGKIISARKVIEYTKQKWR
mgnify:CR=1 FL=1